MSQNLSCKVLIAGDGAVGKSTFLHRLITGNFAEQTITKGHNNVMYETIVGDVALTIMFWDLGGQRQFTPIHKGYLKGAKAVVYTFDLSRINSIDSVNFWHTFIEENITTKPLNFLLGLKSDLLNKQQGCHDMIENICKDLKITKCWYVSAKLNENIQESMHNFAEILVNHIKQ